MYVRMYVRTYVCMYVCMCIYCHKFPCITTDHVPVANEVAKDPSTENWPAMRLLFGHGSGAGQRAGSGSTTPVDAMLFGGFGPLLDDERPTC